MDDGSSRVSRLREDLAARMHSRRMSTILKTDHRAAVLRRKDFIDQFTRERSEMCLMTHQHAFQKDEYDHRRAISQKSAREARHTAAARNRELLADFEKMKRDEDAAQDACREDVTRSRETSLAASRFENRVMAASRAESVLRQNRWLAQVRQEQLSEKAQDGESRIERLHSEREQLRAQRRVQKDIRTSAARAAHERAEAIREERERLFKMRFEEAVTIGELTKTFNTTRARDRLQ